MANNILPLGQQGKLRHNPMYVLGNDDKIEYVACDPYMLKDEMERFINETKSLIQKNLDPIECFYYASMVHLIFVKIHPFQDGNGRMGRLLEKWFLQLKLGSNAASINLEKNYFLKRKEYYFNLRNLGLEYDNLNYSKSLNFLKMTILGFVN